MSCFAKMRGPRNKMVFHAARRFALVACLMISAAVQNAFADGPPMSEAPCCEAPTRAGLAAHADHQEQARALVVGSSIMEKWARMDADLTPTPVLNHGVSGSQTPEWLPGAATQHWESKVMNQKPKMLVYYCGSNDINARRPAEEILGNAIKFISAFRAIHPDVPVLYLSVIRAPQKRIDGLVAEVDRVNHLVREWCATQRRVVFLDVNPALVDATGNALQADSFEADQLHLSEVGYRRMAELVRPAVSGLGL
jgi:lysophospholipase L1-like esterase